MKKTLSLFFTAAALLIQSFSMLTISAAAEDIGVTYRYNADKSLLIIDGSGAVTSSDAAWKNDEAAKSVSAIWFTDGITSIEPNAFDTLTSVTRVYGGDSLFDTKYDTTHTFGGKEYPGTASATENKITNVNYSFSIKPDYKLETNDNIVYYLSSGTADNYYCHNNASKSAENLHTIGGSVKWSYDVENQKLSLGMAKISSTNYSLGFFDSVVSGGGNYYPWTYLSKDDTAKGFKSSDTMVKSVKIEEGVTRLGKKVVNYSQMTSLLFPTTLQMLCEYSIMSCTALKSVTLPGNIASLKNNCFNGCSNLEEIIIQDGDPDFTTDDTANHSHTAACSINADAFKGLSNLKYVFIPSRTSLSNINYLSSSILGKTSGWTKNQYLNGTTKTDITVYYVNSSDMAKSYADTMEYNSVQLSQSGTVGGNDSLTWSWDSVNKTLSFSGSGTIPAAYGSTSDIVKDRSFAANQWRAYSYSVKAGTTLKIGQNIDVEKGAFDNFVWVKSVYTGLKYFNNPAADTARPYNKVEDLSLDRSYFDVNKSAAATPVWGTYYGVQSDTDISGTVDYSLDIDTGVLTFKQTSGTLCGSLSSSDGNTPRLYPWYPIRSSVSSIVFDTSADTSSVATKKIGKSFARYFNNISSIILPDKVEFIGDNAFEASSADNNLTSVSYVNAASGENFPKTLTATGSEAFASRQGLTSVTLPIILCGNISTTAFRNCSNLVITAYNAGNAKNIPVNDDTVTDGIKELNLLSFFGFDGTSIAAVLPDGKETADLYIGYFNSSDNMTLIGAEKASVTPTSYIFSGYADKARELGAAYIKVFLWDSSLSPVFPSADNEAVAYTIAIQ